MYRMSALEYKQIFLENQLNRSELVLTLEEGIRCLANYASALKNEGKSEQALLYQEQAEEAKWVAIFTAMDEKEQGWGYLEKLSQKEQIRKQKNVRLWA